MQTSSVLIAQDSRLLVKVNASGVEPLSQLAYQLKKVLSQNQAMPKNKPLRR
jgi:hypothetical protein